MSKTNDIDAGKSLGEILSDAIKRKGQTPTFTHLQMEAALCIWEDLLERRWAHHEIERTGSNTYPNEEAAEFGAALNDFWENVGTVEMRHAAIYMSARAVEDFAALEAAIGRDEVFETWGSYDWEWIPAWVYAAVDLSAGHLLPRDSGTVVQGMIREHYKNAFTDNEWRNEVWDGKTTLGYEAWRDEQIAAALKQGHVGI